MMNPYLFLEGEPTVPKNYQILKLIKANKIRAHEQCYLVAHRAFTVIKKIFTTYNTAIE